MEGSVIMEGPISIIFRIVAGIMAIVAAWLGYNIYKHTRGATKGWVYMSIFSFSLAIWSVATLLFMGPEMAMPRYWSGILLFMVMSYIIPLAYSTLCVDFKLKVPRWINPRVSFLVITLMLLTLLGINFYQLSIQRFLSITHYLLGLSLLFSAIPTFYLMHRTKRAPWILAFIFCIVSGFALDAGQYYNNCCGEKIATDPFCDDYDLDYNSVYWGSCYMPFVYFGRYYQLYLLIGFTFALVSFYQSYRKLS
jgi:hypothetical protein